MTRRNFPTTPPPSDDDSLSITYTEKGNVWGDTVFISVEGIQVLSSESGNFDAVNGYTFIDAANTEIGGLYARDDSGQNIIALQVLDEAGAGDDTSLHLISAAGSSATANLDISCTIDGQSTSTNISMTQIADTRSDIDFNTDPDVGRIRIRPKLWLLGQNALHNAYVYIKDSYLIIKYQDGPTTRYKYLDLSGTRTTWQHSTAEP